MKQNPERGLLSIEQGLADYADLITAVLFWLANGSAPAAPREGERLVIGALPVTFKRVAFNRVWQVAVAVWHVCRRVCLMEIDGDLGA